MGLETEANEIIVLNDEFGVCYGVSGFPILRRRVPLADVVSYHERLKEMVVHDFDLQTPAPDGDGEPRGVGGGGEERPELRMDSRILPVLLDEAGERWRPKLNLRVWLSRCRWRGEGKRPFSPWTARWRWASSGMGSSGFEDANVCN